MPKQPANCLRCPGLRQRPGLGKQLRSSCFAKIARNRVPFRMNHFMSDVFVGDGVAHNHRPVVRCKLSPNVGADLGGLANCCAFSQARNAFFAFSPNLPSISPAEKCARSSGTCSLMPAGVGFGLRQRLFRGLGGVDRCRIHFGSERGARHEHQDKAEENASRGKEPAPVAAASHPDHFRSEGA